MNPLWPTYAMSTGYARPGTARRAARGALDLHRQLVAGVARLELLEPRSPVRTHLLATCAGKAFRHPVRAYETHEYHDHENQRAESRDRGS
jgi:hypothetical protein